MASVVRDEVRRAGFQSVGAVVRRCTTFGLYMAWAWPDSQGLSLDVADVMKLTAIDQSYLCGPDKYGDCTKIEYRSRHGLTPRKS